ncbi:MAG: histidine kinase [Limimaricola sp.]|uniref:DUF6446 family protein n=1 Tax=Limimaricola sp. TaxID=2211665 RepID=UPI001D86F6B7|nr:DUF6446 family protein [Limimaricola sp.]MBI1416170.1 histidine kinase [Limimaricola sp.]
MNARLAILAILVTAVIAGGGLYYLQVYAFYSPVTAARVAEVQLVSVATGKPELIAFDNFNAIDSDSSPIRYRACFTTGVPIDVLKQTYQVYSDPEPLNAPRWFSCFNAQDIGAALEKGEAVAFHARDNLVYGVDRVAAIFPDGRGYEWNQINACGAVVYNGDPAPEGCPPAPEGLN